MQATSLPLHHREDAACNVVHLADGVDAEEVAGRCDVVRTGSRVPVSGEARHRDGLGRRGRQAQRQIDTRSGFGRRDGWIDVRDLSGHPDPIWLRHTGEVFHFEHLGNLLYVQINQVGDSADETLAHFAQRLHDEIAASKPEKVAIDLRLNRGGDGTLIVPLVRALIQSENIDRTGHLFAIIGPATFSAAQMLADALEKYTNATFVGGPSGSKGNTYGDSRKIILPNSRITVRAAIYYWQDWYPASKRDTIAPQIPASLTFDAYRNNTDPALTVIENAWGAESMPYLSYV